MSPLPHLSGAKGHWPSPCFTRHRDPEQHGALQPCAALGTAGALPAAPGLTHRALPAGQAPHGEHEPAEITSLRPMPGAPAIQKLHPPVLALPCLPLLFSLSIYQDKADSEPDPPEPYFGKDQFCCPAPQAAPESSPRAQRYPRAAGPAPARPGTGVSPSRSGRRAKAALLSDKAFPINKCFHRLPEVPARSL